MLPNNFLSGSRHRVALTYALAALIALLLVQGSTTLVTAQDAYPRWTFTGNLSIAHRLYTATLLQNGKVLVAGGLNNMLNSCSRGSCFKLNTAELFDPAAGSWTTTGNLNIARADHSATMLPNGKVLVAGGVGSSRILNSAELYDPTSGTWSSTGNLNRGRFGHTATLLATGKRLIAGGYDGSLLTSAELYDPATGTWSTTGSLNGARFGTAVLLLNGKVLAVAGD